MKKISIGTWAYCVGPYMDKPIPFPEVVQGLKKLKFDGLELGAFFSHPIAFDPPVGITIKVENPTKLVVSGADKALVGQVAADIRDFRPPEPYKGKGVRYEGEYIRRKAGKAAGTTSS